MTSKLELVRWSLAWTFRLVRGSPFGADWRFACVIAGQIVYAAAAWHTGMLPVERWFGSGRSPTSADWISVLVHVAVVGLVVRALWRYRARRAYLSFEREVFDGARAEPLGAPGSAWPDAANDATLSAAERIVKLARVDGVPTDLDRREGLRAHFAEAFDNHESVLGESQGACLRLGILGTFLGLSLALLGLEGTLGAEAFTSPLLFAALQSCFTTSISGLIGASSIALLDRKLAHDSELTASSLRAFLDASAVRGLATGRAASEDRSLHRILRGTLRSLLALADHVERQTLTIEQGVARVQRARADLDAFLDGVDTIQARLLNDLAAIAARIQPDEWAGRVERGFRETLTSVSARMERSLEERLAALASPTEALSEAHRAFASLCTAAEARIETWGAAAADPAPTARAEATIERLERSLERLLSEMRLRLREDRALAPAPDPILSAIERSTHAICVALNGKSSGPHAATGEFVLAAESRNSHHG